MLASPSVFQADRVCPPNSFCASIKSWWEYESFVFLVDYSTSRLVCCETEAGGETQWEI